MIKKKIISKIGNKPVKNDVDMMEFIQLDEISEFDLDKLQLEEISEFDLDKHYSNNEPLFEDDDEYETPVVKKPKRG